jgi:tripartite-type tricarboxylate transporter receptor subunit TctC
LARTGRSGKTPPEIVARLSSWFAEAIQSPDVKPKLLDLGLFPIGQCGGSFRTFLQQQFEDYGRNIRAANIKLQ